MKLANHAHRQGKKIPEDVQIVSYDGFFNVFKDNNIITCVEQQVEEMAKKCIEILIVVVLTIVQSATV